MSFTPLLRSSPVRDGRQRSRFPLFAPLLQPALKVDIEF